MDRRLILMAVLCLSFAQVVYAVPDQFHFAQPKDQQRFYSLSKELRCTVCQNQSIAESSSSHAIDMRAQIYHMINSGETDGAIRDYLAYRYGDHVLFAPRWSFGTFALWLIPAIMLIGASWFSIRMYRCSNI